MRVAPPITSLPGIVLNAMLADAQQVLGRRQIGDGKTNRRKPRAVLCRRRRAAETAAEADRIDDGDLAALGLRRQAYAVASRIIAAPLIARRKER